MLYTALSCTPCRWWTFVADEPTTTRCPRCGARLRAMIYEQLNVNLLSGEALVQIVLVRARNEETNGHARESVGVGAA